MADAHQISLTLTQCLREIAVRLTNAARITNAAIACAEVGGEEEAVRIVMDLESYTYEADKLLSVITLMSRLSKAR
jgi:hypothetical protein